MTPARRRRLSADRAKQNILEAAEKQLIEGGPDSVRVQPLARSLGITDAAIHHHFGSREELLMALLRFGGKRLREAMREAGGQSGVRPFDVGRFVDDTRAVFGDRGYSRLAMWLAAAGWRQNKRGCFMNEKEARAAPAARAVSSFRGGVALVQGLRALRPGSA